MNNEILASLNKAAVILVQQMNNELSDGTRPHEIKENIFIGQATQTGDGAKIEITIDHPAASAYEYGSGLHRMKGSPQKYRIEGRPKLAFPISRWPNFVPPPHVSYAVFPGPISNKNYVMHPGVAPNQFIAPSLVRTKDQIRKVLGQGFKAAVLVGREKVTTITVK